MYDKLETIGQSVVQHGKYNDRIYLLDLNPKDIPKIFGTFNSLLKENKYAKIIAKVPEKYKHVFYEKGFFEEANVPNFYNGNEKMLFLAKYHKHERKIDKEKHKAEKVLKAANKKQVVKYIKFDNNFSYKVLDESYTEQMIKIYKKVFTTYPFPIFNGDYILETMNDNIIYFGVFKKNELIAISSCEINYQKSYVEMTDFAVLEKYRGRKIPLYLLKQMEDYMKKKGIKKAYTMARALSYGMNIAFKKMGYEY